MTLNKSYFDTNEEIDEQFSEYSDRLAVWFNYFSNDEYEHETTHEKFMYFVWLKSSHDYPRIMCNNLLCKYIYLLIYYFLYIFFKKTI
jgi:hypothetical protein